MIHPCIHLVSSHCWVYAFSLLCHSSPFWAFRIQLFTAMALMSSIHRLWSGKGSWKKKGDTAWKLRNNCTTVRLQMDCIQTTRQLQNFVGITALKLQTLETLTKRLVWWWTIMPRETMVRAVFTLAYVASSNIDISIGKSVSDRVKL